MTMVMNRRQLIAGGIKAGVGLAALHQLPAMVWPAIAEVEQKS